jgi:hypothetical protein
VQRKVRLEERRARAEEARRVREKLKLIRYKVERRQAFAIQRQWRLLKSNARRWRRFLWRRSAIRRAIPKMRRARVKLFLARWIHKWRAQLKLIVVTVRGAAVCH